MEARRGDVDRQQQRPPPQTCPRCESNNTKFCYYNNNRTTQPRYFCKTCRRYWTHGGTQRNIPVGGVSRKEKQKKASSSSNGEGSLRSSVTSLPLPPQALQISQNVSSNIATIQKLNLTPPQPQGTTRPLSLGASQMGSSGYGNTSLLQGFLMGSTMRPQQTQVLQIQQPNNFRMGNHGKEPLHSFDQKFSESMRSSGSWNPSFANNKNNVMTTSSSTFWNYNSNDNINNMLESSLSPNEWSDLPDYGPPEF